MTDWLNICLHAFFVVDRVEPPYAIVEWSETALFSEIPQNQFPILPTEGSTWVVHFLPHEKGTKDRSAWTNQRLTDSVKADLEHADVNYKIQSSSIFDFHSKP